MSYEESNLITIFYWMIFLRTWISKYFLP